MDQEPDSLDQVLPWVDGASTPTPGGDNDDDGSTVTAAAFDDQSMVRRRGPASMRGWRRAVFGLTFGAINPRPGIGERREQALVEQARTRIHGSRRVVVISRKGGAGKTTTTLMLGQTFGALRGDRVVALDANPDAGSLAQRVQRETTETVTTMLAAADTLDRYAEMREFTSQDVNTRLEVVASDDDPRITEALAEAEYQQAIELLDKHYNLLLVDTGTGILDSAIQGVLREADQLVVVMPPALDGARVAASTLDWLEEHGYAELAHRSIAVINAVRESELLQLDQVEAHFSARCAATVQIPWDPALMVGARTGLADLKPRTRYAYLTLAAAVASGFSAPPRRRALGMQKVTSRQLRPSQRRD